MPGVHLLDRVIGRQHRDLTLTGVPADRREAVAGEVQALLAPFVMRHEVKHF